MQKGFYHPVDGYWETLCEPSPEILASYPPGTIEIPLKPGPLYTFNGFDWVAPTEQQVYEAAVEAVRLDRNFKLTVDVDPVVSNPLRWADMSAEKQQEWASYRLALLNISDAPGYPFDVTWPVKPD